MAAETQTIERAAPEDVWGLRFSAWLERVEHFMRGTIHYGACGNWYGGLCRNAEFFGARLPILYSGMGGENPRGYVGLPASETGHARLIGLDQHSPVLAPWVDEVKAYDGSRYIEERYTPAGLIEVDLAGSAAEDYARNYVRLLARQNRVFEGWL